MLTPNNNNIYQPLKFQINDETDFCNVSPLCRACVRQTQTADTVKITTGQRLVPGYYPENSIPPKWLRPILRGMTFAKTVHIIFSRRRPLRGFGSNHIIAGKADGCGERIYVESHDQRVFLWRKRLLVICEDGKFLFIQRQVRREPKCSTSEWKDFLEYEDTKRLSHTDMNIYYRGLGNESPLLVKLDNAEIYKEHMTGKCATLVASVSASVLNQGHLYL